jgi:hypothetical protein
MRRHIVLPMLAAVGLAMLASSFAVTSIFAQDTPYSKEYMQQHDGGDRVEYLQEMEHNDSPFYVPPAN